MLHTPAPFPHPGSIAYLKLSGQKVRIVQHKADDHVLVSIPVLRDCSPAATQFIPYTVPLADLFPDGEAAMLAGKPARRGRRGRTNA